MCSDCNATVVLATANARYTHASLGLRCLADALRSVPCRVETFEFTLDHSPWDIAEAILRRAPRIVGLGVYIWNVRLMADAAGILKAARPDLLLIGGGPELFREPDAFPAFDALDAVICGEGEQVCPDLVRDALQGRPLDRKVLEAPPVPDERIPLPVDLYTDEDLARRTVYLETSRGCPCQCAYCLSAVEKGVRYVPIERVARAVEELLRRGARRIKLVDRTFNLDPGRMADVLSLFQPADAWPGLSLHLEIHPGFFREAEMLPLLRAFPDGVLHLEVGIQSLNPVTREAIRRGGDPDRDIEVTRLLLRKTGVDVHVDLIAGLPFDSEASIREGFDRLYATGAHEVQLGILKRLRGSPITTAPGEDIVFNPAPPYEVIRTRWLSWDGLARTRQVARMTDLFHNRGRFRHLLPWAPLASGSPWAWFLGLAGHVAGRHGALHGIALPAQERLLRSYLSTCFDGAARSEALERLDADARIRMSREERLPGQS
ncbi:MAG TPA: DUF4080 domain-containing protein [Candidatus Hydrogenedentes bacterium]|nr:DUF4080 domain-containing protein [Candidatus Hydrogenedentota bacterium]